ncbi:MULTISPECIES: carbohydrate ABC transporter permease [Amycolatopsis]|uniref:Carbohydrate ABC transporter membrane protein 1 (CUT1 family) n=2 Tax=Amycolatopsis TaxID=1813 RepID=A0A3N2H5T3_9PSEU|nr:MULTISPECIES: sugar ABC transporter permease [Amycolatopsis]MCF6423800.1 sugar ABC transporter permease [Amycolatopsis tucumanensis]ROS44256.1 carbohydrate ABC transporter membrane protein 1 (CUT1 family) [Amycolatopsis thermoflava]
MFVEVALPAPIAVPVAERPALVRRVLRAAPPYLYLAPALALLVIWTYRPLVQTAQLSFFSWNLLPTQPMVPVGLANYERLIDLPELGQAVLRTLVVIAGLLPFTVVVPVVAALLTRRIQGRARVVYQALVFAPMLVAPVASAAVWQWMLDPGAGAVNRVLGTDLNWLHETGSAQLAVIGITGWHLLGFAVLVVTAGLAGINSDYSDAAQLDGATRGQVTRWITLPLLSPTLVFLTLMTVLLSAQWTFPLIDTLTQGGPADATTNVYYLLWDYSFHSYDAGLGAAAGMLLFIGFGVIAAGLVWLSERLTFHDD